MQAVRTQETITDPSSSEPAAEAMCMAPVDVPLSAERRPRAGEEGEEGAPV